MFVLASLIDVHSRIAIFKRANRRTLPGQGSRQHGPLEPVSASEPSLG